MSTDADTFRQEQETVELLRSSREKIDHELSKVIVGQKDVIEQLLICLFAGGHCLITGAPGFLGRRIVEVGSVRCTVRGQYQGADFSGARLNNADLGGSDLSEAKPFESAMAADGSSAAVVGSPFR